MRHPPPPPHDERLQALLVRENDVARREGVVKEREEHVSLREAELLVNETRFGDAAREFHRLNERKGL